MTIRYNIWVIPYRLYLFWLAYIARSIAPGASLGLGLGIPTGLMGLAGAVGGVVEDLQREAPSGGRSTRAGSRKEIDNSIGTVVEASLAGKVSLIKSSELSRQIRGVKVPLKKEIIRQYQAR